MPAHPTTQSLHSPTTCNSKFRAVRSIPLLVIGDFNPHIELQVIVPQLHAKSRDNLHMGGWNRRSLLLQLNSETPVLKT